mmetsp:Transcript_14209/g.29870  ORF Transcript_14209/g.29870 Transcript_14209/m.29870 type:complete len:177 (-) Transcript_14209:8-538(-)
MVCKQTHHRGQTKALRMIPGRCNNYCDAANGFQDRAGCGACQSLCSCPAANNYVAYVVFPCSGAHEVKLGCHGRMVAKNQCGNDDCSHDSFSSLHQCARSDLSVTYKSKHRGFRPTVMTNAARTYHCSNIRSRQKLTNQHSHCKSNRCGLSSKVTMEERKSLPQVEFCGLGIHELV